MAIGAQKVGISDVAAAAGVSISTVSAALNDVEGARISPKTRQRIREAAERLGYAPDRLARGLRRRSSGIVGFVGDYVATTPYAVRMVLGAQETLRDAGRLMLLVNSEGDPALEAQEIAALRQQHVDGVLYASMYHRRVEPPRLLDGVPTVLLDAESDDPAVSWVVPDEVAGARAAVRELLAYGHRRIGFVNNDEDIPATRLRLHGYTTALEAAGVRVDPALICAAPSTSAGAHRAARHLLALDNPPTALFCFKDIMAMGAYRAALEVGLSIPDGLSVVGYDNMDVVAEGLFPELTTVQLPHYEMGSWAARQLLALIAPQRGPAAHARLSGELVRRGSVARPPGVR